MAAFKLQIYAFTFIYIDIYKSEAVKLIILQLFRDLFRKDISPFFRIRGELMH